MNSHSVPSSLPLVAMALQFVQSLSEKQHSVAEVLEKSVRKACNWKAGFISCIVVFSGLFLSSTLVSKHTEGISLSAGQGI